MSHDLQRAAPAAASIPQLTVRAVLTGMLLGSALSLCNLYTGLKIGWSNSMSITAALLGFAGWRVMQRAGARPFGLLENNINQTAASSAAYASSAGLVAPIPALTMITGQTLPWPLLALWVLSVMLLGVMVAISTRRQMIEVSALPFPFGIATAEMMVEMAARGREAVKRVMALLSAAAIAGALKVAKELWKLKKPSLPLSISIDHPTLAKRGIAAATLKNLSLAMDPALLFVGVGALIGMRACASMLLGALLAWGVLGPYVLEQGWAAAGKLGPDKVWFGAMVKWMLWPGVTLMVSSALSSVALTVPATLRRWRAQRPAQEGTAQKGSSQNDTAQDAPSKDASSEDANARDAQPETTSHEVPKRWFLRAFAMVLLLSLGCQIFLFHIRWWMALLGVLLSFALAIVAARVSGETGITPIGPMGKVTQLIFGVIEPSAATANLMTANVTGGAASQCGDMLHDLKTGWLLGAWPRHQAVAQAFGALAGALAGSAAYLLLIPNPTEQLLTDEWPAPAAAQWKAVAELFKEGLSSLPAGTPTAIVIAAAAGIGLSLLQHLLPKQHHRFIPSAASVGLAFVIPAYYAVNVFIGGLAGLLAQRYLKSWAARFLVVVASGLIVGESLAGVGFAIKAVLAG